MSDWMNHNGIEVPDSTPGEAGEKLKNDLLTLADTRPKLVTVADDTERFALSAEDIHIADIIAVTDGDRYYLVQDPAHLNSENGYLRLNPTAISALADDPAPQLGGDLDLSTHDIYDGSIKLFNTPALTWNDGMACPSVDVGQHQLLANAGGDPHKALDWDEHCLYSDLWGSQVKVLDWQNRQLLDDDESTPLLTWGGGIVSIGESLNGGSNGDVSLGTFGSRVYVQTTLDIGNSVLMAEGYGNVIQPDSGDGEGELWLYADGILPGATSGRMLDSDEKISVDWQNRQLSAYDPVATVNKPLLTWGFNVYGGIDPGDVYGSLRSGYYPEDTVLTWGGTGGGGEGEIGFFGATPRGLLSVTEAAGDGSDIVEKFNDLLAALGQTVGYGLFNVQPAE